MKITYHGAFPIDVAGFDGVEPGETIDVPDEVGVSLLGAGASHDHLLDDAGERVVDSDGLFVMVATPHPAPLWTAAETAAAPKPPKPPKPTTSPSDDSPADAGKD